MADAASEHKLALKYYDKTFIDDEPPIKRINSINFGVHSTSDILKISEIEIFNDLLYNHQNGSVYKNGPLDLKLGVNAKKIRCQTCNVCGIY